MIDDKIIKEIKVKKLNYIFGYILNMNKVYPYLKIYKGKEYICGCRQSFNNLRDYSYFGTYYFSKEYDTLPIKVIFEELEKILFNKTLKNIHIPQNIREEYINLFLLYKLNNFNEF